jgi:hypothetical protein
MFSKARAADAEHGLPIDEERLDAVFLEFALAGALPVKVLAGYGKEMLARMPAQEALERFTRLCVRRTAGGLPPSAQMTAELRKLAKAAGAEADAVERDFLVELLALPATLRAAVGWWKAHRTALIALAKQDPAIRRMLLDTVPVSREEELPPLWLGLLLASGAADALHDPAAPDELRPADGTGGWLRRFQQFRQQSYWWRAPIRLPELYSLVERCADRLRADRAAATLPIPADVDLLDLLLCLGIPVADPPDNEKLDLQRWSEGEGQRDLVALAADQRFRRAFHRGADGFNNNEEAKRTISMLAASPGGGPMLAEWVRAIARGFAAVGLPGLPDAIQRLSWLPGDALALAEAEVRAAAATDLAPVLARTLRAGLFDELTWPAWEEAAAALVPAKDVDELIVADAWPHLIVAGPTQARVIGADGTVLAHDLRIPAQDRPANTGYHYADGELLVYWSSRTRNGELVGYWHGSADRVQPIQARTTHSTRLGWLHVLNSTLPLPGGGRLVGGGVLHRGDTAVPDDGWVLGDGTSYWVWVSDGSQDGNGWYEYEPATGRRGRRSNPAFFDQVLRDAPAHSYLSAGVTLKGGSLRPLDDGLDGRCAVVQRNGELRCREVSGLEVVVPQRSHTPVRALAMPGDDRPRALVRGSYEVAIIDADGVVTAQARTDRAPGAFGRGTLILPPNSHWHCMRPRDPEGSAALRRIDDTLAALLLKAGAEQRAASAKQDRLPELVAELLPQVTDKTLLTGIAGVVHYAAAQQATLDETAARLDGALASGGNTDTGPMGPDDSLFSEALRSLGAARLYWTSSAGGDAVFRQLRLIGEALREDPRAHAPLPLHLDGPALPSSNTGWWTPMLDACSAVALRAASPVTPPQMSEALREVLRVFDEAALAAPADRNPWRRVTVFLPDGLLNKPDGNRRGGSWHGLLPTAGGGLLAVVTYYWGDNGIDFTALYHDPSGKYEIPAPYTLRGTEPVGERREEGWLSAFLAELAQRGPAPWFPEAAEEFARLTGTTPTEARLVTAGLPGIESNDRATLPAEARALLGSKAGEITVAREQLQKVAPEARRAVVAALLPADPARLWTEGPDVAAAAQVWNRRVGKRVAVPEALLAESAKAVHTNWAPPEALPALLDPAASPHLSRDVAQMLDVDRIRKADKDAVGFDVDVLKGATALMTWLAHRLPAGDPIRGALPAALRAVRDRLAYPDLLLSLGRYAFVPKFRAAAGSPTEVSGNFERYGAIILATRDSSSQPVLRVSLLDETGGDPYLAVLRGEAQVPFPFEVCFALVRDPQFEALLGDPGDPAAGGRDGDGTWWPQDPVRSVPDLVAEAAREYGLGEDAAALYLMLLTMPDPTDRNTARWTGWKPARLAAARAALAATDLVVTAARPRAGRSLFLPGGWAALKAPHLPLEQWKMPYFSRLTTDGWPVLSVVAPTEPAAALYRRAWERVRAGDGPRFEELKVPRARARGRR